MSVCLTDINTAYVVGAHYNQFTYYGLILKTINGGINWTVASNEIGSWLYSVYFVDESTGYAVGGGPNSYPEGTILKTIDGGATWEVLSSLTTIPLFLSVFFTDANTGYVIGKSFYSPNGFVGCIIKTIDGGESWTEIQDVPSPTLSSIFFSDTNVGYVVGDGGTILKTINGGGFVTINEKAQVKSLFTFYPNPTKNKITVANEKEILGEINVNIINISGQQLMQAQFQNQKQFEMDVSTLAKGIYLVKIQTNALNETKKLVIQ